MAMRQSYKIGFKPNTWLSLRPFVNMGPAQAAVDQAKNELREEIPMNKLK